MSQGAAGKPCCALEGGACLAQPCGPAAGTSVSPALEAAAPHPRPSGWGCHPWFFRMPAPLVHRGHWTPLQSSDLALEPGGRALTRPEPLLAPESRLATWQCLVSAVGREQGTPGPASAGNEPVSGPARSHPRAPGSRTGRRRKSPRLEDSLHFLVRSLFLISRTPSPPFFK